MKPTKGIVQWFNDAKGYGFIRAIDNPSQDIFVHYSAIETVGFKTLEEGQHVEFTLIHDRAGPIAKDVIKGEVGPAQCSQCGLLSCDDMDGCMDERDYPDHGLPESEGGGF